MMPVTLQRYERWPEQNLRFGEGGRRLRGELKNSSREKPLISIIVAVFNGETYFEETLERILSQNYPQLELIVVDGGSTDRTIEILKKFDSRIDYWVSEKDKGIADAFNRGVQLTRGDYINFQGDGDGFIDPDSVQKMMTAFLAQPSPRLPSFIASRIRRVDLNGKQLYESKPMTASKAQFLFRMVFPHQGLFTHISVFEKYGLFDPAIRYAMDYEHLLRAFQILNDTFVYNEVTAQWRQDGVGQGKTAEVLKEYDRVKRKNKIASPFALTLIDRWSHLKYQIKKQLGLDT